MRWFALLTVGLLACLLPAPGWGQVPACADGAARAGNPQEVAPWARPTDTGRYVGYYLGGGSASLRRGEPPRADEGTWGWDFMGGLIRRRVMLDWWHGRRYQGGTGAFRTDGPKILHPLGEGK